MNERTRNIKGVMTGFGLIAACDLALVATGFALRGKEPQWINPIKMSAETANREKGSSAKIFYHDTRDGNWFVDEHLDGTLDYVIVGLEPWVGEPGELFRREDPEFAKYLSKFEESVYPLAIGRE